MPNKRLFHAIRKSDEAALRELREEAAADGEALSLETETFKSMQVTGLDLSGIDLSNTEWDECSFDRVHFGDANLNGAYFRGSMLLKCTFEGTQLDAAALDGCVLRGCRIDGADVRASELTDVQMEGTTIENLELDNIYWSSVIMTKGRLANIEGTSGTLSGVKLRDVDVENFDPGDVDVDHCTTTPLDGEPPTGFVAREGRRRRI